MTSIDDDDDFNGAVKWARTAKVSSDQDKLQLYGLYKIVSESPQPTKSRPAFWEMTERAKWDSWKKLGDELSDDQEKAKQLYIELAKRLGWDGSSTSTKNDNNDQDGNGEGEEGEGGGSGSGGGMASVSKFSQISDLPSGSNVLHELAENGDVNSLQLQLHSTNFTEEQLNQKNSFGCTPLHIAADKGHVNMVKALLQLGADRNVQDNDGLTPLEIAQVIEEPQIISMLQQTT